VEKHEAEFRTQAACSGIEMPSIKCTKYKQRKIFVSFADVSSEILNAFGSATGERWGSSIACERWDEKGKPTYSENNRWCSTLTV
jgi:hypothetical protein